MSFPTVGVEILDKEGKVVISFRGELVRSDDRGSRFASGNFSSGDRCVIFFHPKTEQGTYGYLTLSSPSRDSNVEGDFMYDGDTPVDVIWDFPKPVFNFEPDDTLKVHITTSAPPLQ